MTDQQHPITPPPELFKQWEGMPRSLAFEAAYRAGADAELEACVEWLREARNHGFGYDHGAVLAGKLRADRLPKPPSLAEQALKALDKMNAPLGNVTASRCDTIRRALERLQELEKGNE